MGNTIITGPLLSQDEIHALFSFEPSQDSSLSDSCETNKPGIIDSGCNTNGATSMPASEPARESDNVENQNKNGVDDIITSKSPVAHAEEVTRVNPFQGFLTFEAILRGCRQILKEHFPLGRISLVQPRGNKTTATVHSLNEDGNATITGPYVINLEPSRLKECLLKQQLIVASVRVSELDDTERDYLLALSSNQRIVSIIYLPLILHGRLKGVLVLNLRETVRMTDDNTAFLWQMAGLMAIAIENRDRFHVECRRSRQFTLVSKIAKLAVSEIEDNMLFPEVCELLRKSFDYNSVQIWVVTPDRLDLMGHACRTPREVEAEQRITSMVQECSRRGQIVCNDDLHSEFDTEPNCDDGSQLAAPIHFGGKCSGVLFIDSGRSDSLTSEDVNGMESVAALIASRLHNLLVFKNSQRSGEYLQAVLEAANDWAILSTDIHGYVITCSVGLQRVFRLSQQEILGKDLLNLFTNPQVQRELITFINGNANAPCLERFHVPQANGKTTAYLDLTFQRVYDHDKQHIGFLCVVRDATKKLLLLQKLKELTITDDVTGLYNQRGFFRALRTEMRRCQKYHQNFSLCFLDLDNLKQFNDTYGHLSGSQALKETAGLLRQLVRPNIDICCRYGGDEFAIIMPQIGKIEANSTIEKIRVLLSEHFEGKMTGSFGIADVSNRIIEAMELLAKADRAMYRAKSQGKNCIVLSD
jgi:diguanylate cyclase (GGDEF)-like protein/PAS domain S-box-containing protein